MAINRKPAAGDKHADQIDTAFPPAAIPAPRQSPENEPGVTLPPGATYVPFDPPTPAGVPATLDEALALFQAEIPSVSKNGIGRVGENGSREYAYGTLEDIHAAALPRLGRLGLSWRCKPTLTEHGFGLVYRLRHVSGEEEEGFWPLGDPKQIRPQAMGSAITYAKRYCFCAVTGIAPMGDDDDGKAAQQEATERQQYERNPSNWTATKPVDLQGLSLQELAEQYQNLPERDKKIQNRTYGAEFVRRVEDVHTLDEVKEFYTELLHVCGNDLKQANVLFPWSHDGIMVGKHLATRKKEIEAQSINRYTEFEEMIAAANTPERLEEVDGLIQPAYEAGELAEGEPAKLSAFIAEREKKMVSTPRPAPAPAADDSSDPWENAVPEPSAADDFGDFEAGAAPVADEPAGPSQDYPLFYAKIWHGGGAEDLQLQLDTAVEEGGLTSEEYNGLSVMLSERPTALPALCRWRAEKAPATAALDTLRDEVVNLQAKGQLDDIRHITAAVAKRRIELKEKGL